ncbi:MAG TPA: adenylyltransferase/cytidyltransferase family protein, partial [Gaiellaceae bacterium]|nr:adenylyltransferase/cytidyltransferase family protein [Gaiellaceae bacterium]
MSWTAAIGTFDGVHRGHRRVVETAKAYGHPVKALTFHPHPRSVVQGNRVEHVTTLERRVELLREAGAHEVVVLPFTLETAAQSPQEFARTHLAGATAVACGADFRFGHRRAGD